MLNGMGSAKPLYPPTTDPDLRSASPRYVTASTNSCPPPHVLEKHFSSPTEESHPRFNVLNKTRPRSSALLNVNDAMAMHLLVETAIVDSTEYEILSYEEVDDLKKEYKILASRIDASKRRLALESKVRDAALSLSRLYSKKGRQRRSLLGGVSEVTKHTDEELMASNRKCEELSQELWRLNNRAVEIQRRLLQHGAGILGMTHHGGINMPRSPLAPGSPSSSYALVNRRGTMTSLNVEFDDRSFYRTPDKLNEFGKYDPKLPVEKDSNRFQQRPEMTMPPSPQPAKERQAFAPSDDPYTTRRLEDLNNQLRKLLVRTTSTQSLPPPPHLPVNGAMNGIGLQDQISLLEQNIDLIQQSQFVAPLSVNPQAAHELEKAEVILSSLWDMLVLGEAELRSQRMQTEPEENEYPDSEEEIDYDEDRVFSISAFSAKVQALYTRATQLRSERNMLRQKVSQQRSLFESQNEAMKEQHREREDDLNGEVLALTSQLEQLVHIVDQRESDIMTANGKLNNMMNELNATQIEAQQKRDDARIAREELTAVMERLDIARRKDQQRTMEDNAGRGKEAMALEAERQARAEAEDDLIAQIREKEEQLADLQNQCDEIKEDRDIANAELDSVVTETGERLRKLEEELVTLREAMEDAKNQSVEQEALLRVEVEAKEQQLKKMDEEMRELEGKAAELSTEVALLKAELDSAYGSRKQRAAETAEARAAAAALEAAGNRQVVDPGLLQEVEDLAMKNHELMEEIAQIKAEKSNTDSNLEKRCKLLQNELDEMLADFENLTKQSIEFENERIKLEGLVDELRARCEGLETSLADEKVRWLGVRTAGEGKLSSRRPSDIPGESTSSSVLRSEFRKMTRELRADQTKALRVEQEERRKLEGIVRSLKREQLQRKSHTPVSSNQ